MDASLLARITDDGMLSPAARETFAQLLAAESNGHHPLATVTRVLVEEEFSEDDWAAIAVLTLDEYRVPEHPWLHLDSILQIALHTLRDAGRAPVSVVEAAVRALSGPTHGAMPRMVTAYLRQLGRECDRYKDLVVAAFTAENYSLCAPQPTAAPQTFRDAGEWERQGWGNFSPPWPLADLFFELDTESTTARILEAVPQQDLPPEQSLAYLVLWKLSQKPDYGTDPLTLTAIGRLMRNASGARLEGLHDRALAVFQERWRRTMPQGLTLMAAEVWLQLRMLGSGFESVSPAEPLPGMNRLYISLVREREAQEAAAAAQAAAESALLPSEAALARKIAAREAALAEKSDIEGWHQLAALYREARLWNKAITAETRVIELHPKAVGAYYWRGKTRMTMRDYAGAVEDFSNAIRIWEFPDGLRKFLELERPSAEYIDSYRTRGVARAHLGSYPAGIGDITTALRLRPQDAKLHFERAYLSEKAGRTSDSVADYHRAGLLYLDEDRKSEVNKCAEALERLGARAEAIQLQAKLAPPAEESDLPL
jgi:tetratricopeptide (TPR) repeat protein